MAEETHEEQPPEPSGEATPNRDRRREAPIIEGEIAETRDSALGPQPDSEAPAAVDAPEVAQESTPRPSAEVPQARARPMASAAIGAAVGAIVAGGGVWYFLQRGAADQEIIARLESLERKPPTASATAVAALDKRVDALEAAAANTPDKASADAFGQRVAALELAALSAKAAADENKDALLKAQAAQDVAAKALALASATAQNADRPASAAPSGQAEGADLNALETRMAKLERDVAALDRTPVDLAGISRRFDKLEAGVAALDRPPVDLTGVDRRLDKLESALAAPKSEIRVAAETTSPSRNDAGLAVAAQALTDRLRAGAPFVLELAALERLGADPARLASLRPLAEKGAPTASALASGFSAVSPAVLAASAPKASGGPIDRLMANLGKMVQVTPIGEVAGDDPPALVSQIAGALERGRIGPAVTTWARLPEAGRQTSQTWADAAQARLAADAAAQALLADAMTRLAAARN